MANDVLYEVRITFDFGETLDNFLSCSDSKPYAEAVPKTIVFRSDCPLEMASQLANSLWSSTNNEKIQVSVCENGGSVPLIIFHARS